MRLLWSLCRKCLLFSASLLILSLAVFYAARLAPGDPLVSYYGDRVERMSADERARAEERLGLHEPIHTQYLRWLGGALKGEFGISFKYKTDVLDVISGRLVNTLLLGGGSLLLIFLLALPLGIFCVCFEDRWPDRLLCRLGAAVSCVPEFWLSLALILLFSVTLRLFPSSGAGQGTLDRLWHLVLPLSAVTAGHLWYAVFLVRGRLLEEVRMEYVLLAKSKGLSKAYILFRHCLRNILPSYLFLMAVFAPHILGGTYVVEMVFSYPGLGALSYESARYRDYNLLMLLCILTGGAVMLFGMLAQALGELLDPRLKREGDSHG